MSDTERQQTGLTERQKTVLACAGATVGILVLAFIVFLTYLVWVRAANGQAAFEFIIQQQQRGGAPAAFPAAPPPAPTTNPVNPK